MEFIKNTLVSIKNGVSEANKEFNSLHFAMFSGTEKENYVHFDVAVSVSSESKKTGGGGIKIYVVDLGGEKSNKNFQENISRIKFSIRIRTDIA